MKLVLCLNRKDGGDPRTVEIGHRIEVPLNDSRPVVIGREAGVDVVIDAPSVGRRVAAFTRAPGGVVIEDLGSGGGSSILIEGELVRRPRCSLPKHFLLWIGAVEFFAEIVDDAMEQVE